MNFEADDLAPDGFSVQALNMKKIQNLIGSLMKLQRKNGEDMQKRHFQVRRKCWSISGDIPIEWQFQITVSNLWREGQSNSHGKIDLTTIKQNLCHLK